MNPCETCCPGAPPFERASCEPDRAAPRRPVPRPSDVARNRVLHAAGHRTFNRITVLLLTAWIAIVTIAAHRAAPVSDDATPKAFIESLLR